MAHASGNRNGEPAHNVTIQHTHPGCMPSPVVTAAQQPHARKESERRTVRLCRLSGCHAQLTLGQRSWTAPEWASRKAGRGYHAQLTLYQHRTAPELPAARRGAPEDDGRCERRGGLGQLGGQHGGRAERHAAHGAQALRRRVVQQRRQDRRHAACRRARLVTARSCSTEERAEAETELRQALYPIQICGEPCSSAQGQTKRAEVPGKMQPSCCCSRLRVSTPEKQTQGARPHSPFRETSSSRA